MTEKVVTMATASQPERPQGRTLQSQEELSLALLNINGLRNKTHEVKHIIVHHKLHVVALCETKLDASVKDSRVYIPGFRMWRRDRNSSGGGVALYVQDRIKTKPRSDLMKTEAEIIWVEMKLPEGRPVLLGCCYRPPDNQNHLVQIYETVDLVLKEKEEKDILLMGDFNTDWDLQSRKNVAKCVSSKWGLTQIVQHKTRITQKSSSCIDLIYTNIKELNAKSIATGCSDHNLVTVKLRRNVAQKIINFRVNQIDETILNDINETQWTDESDPLKALKKFPDIFLSVANKHLNTQGIYGLLKVNKKMEKFIFKRDKSKHLKHEEIKKKQAAKPDQSDDDSVIGSGVKCFQCGPNDKCQTCMKIENHQKCTENKMSYSIQILKGIMDPHNILKICEKYFGESLPSHVINITEDGDVASDLYYLREEEVFGHLLVQTSNNRPEEFSFSKICEERGNEWLVSLLRSAMKDADIPELDAKLLKCSAGSISGPIRHVLNRCLEERVFPSELKLFDLIPFSTKKLTKFRGNISLHSVHVMMGFIFDMILYKQAEKYFIDEDLIASESIDDQIKNLESDWLRATKSGETVSCLFLDFSSSFDSISHHVLITKLRDFGFSGSALKLTESFLSYQEGSCGLPRGSFFARLLFTVFINELKKDSKLTSAVICQNHMIVYTKAEISKTSEEQMEANVQRVKEWNISHTILFQITRFTISRNTNITSEFELFWSLLVCNQFNVNWVQLLRKFMESRFPSGQEKFKKTFETHKNSFGSKIIFKDSEHYINSALWSLVLL